MKPLTRDESREIDRRAQAELALSADILMENAGRFVAAATLRLMAERGRERVVVVAGPGNNGGDGFVAARHLLEYHSVQVLLVGDPARLQGVARANHERWERLGEHTLIVAEPPVLHHALAADPPPVLIDALFGTGLTRPVEGLAAHAIQIMVAAGHPTLSVDVPSGLDADTGAVLGVAVTADITLTFVAPKTGFLLAEGPAHCGKIEVVPIGFPPSRLTV